jgi:hypothetical protein
MFGLARQIFRHKVGVVALLAFATFMFTRDGDDQKKPSSPWAHNAPASQVAKSSSDNDSLIGSMTDKAVSAAGDLIGETTGIDPEDLREKSVGNFDKANEAYGKANGGN